MYQRKIIGKGRYVCGGATILLCLAASQGGTEDTESIQADRSPIFVDTSLLASPNGQEVVVDLPSAFHWSRYQQGQIGPWTYIIYPDGTAKVLEQDNARDRIAGLVCQAGVSCQVTVRNQPSYTIPAKAGLRPTLPVSSNLDETVSYLAAWILADTAPGPVVVDTGPVAPAAIAGGVAGAPSVNLGADARIAQGAPVLGQAAAPDAQPDALPNPARINVLSASQSQGSKTQDNTDLASIEAGSDRRRAARPVDPTLLRQQVASADIATTVRPVSKTDAQRDFGDAEVTRAASRNAPQIAPPLTFDSAPEPEPEKERKPRPKINCTLTFTGSLGFIKDDERTSKPRYSLGCGTRLTDRLSVRATVFGYKNGLEQEDWDPDYNYAFTYKVNDRITLTYSNYLARYSPTVIPLQALFEGKMRASLKLPPIKLPNDKTVACSSGMGLPNPIVESISLSCGYSVTDKLRIGATTHFYFPGEQDTYNPDYSYTASYRFNDKWQLGYNNYSNNRWSWNKGDDHGPGWTGGSLSLTYRFSF